VKNEENREQKIYELKNKITPFMLRRKKEDVLKELPDKIENIVSVEMNEEQNIAYNIILDKVKADLESLVADKGFNSSQIGILAALTKLRQICNHPNLVFEDSNKAYESAKLETLVELVKESIYAGHKILVFSQFVQMLKLIKEKLDSEEINYEYLDGSTKNRMEVVNKFNESEDKKVFLLSLKAGGTGLNLTSADIVIHVDPWWNPQIERQATDRAHRMGQNKKVMVYKLITKGTVEEKMLKLQDRKKEVFDAVIDSNSGSLSKVTWNDIQELLSVK
jgi:SNF2 family DNA or RNA helicase